MTLMAGVCNLTEQLETRDQKWLLEHVVTACGDNLSRVGNEDQGWMAMIAAEARSCQFAMWTQDDKRILQDTPRFAAPGGYALIDGRIDNREELGSILYDAGLILGRCTDAQIVAAVYCALGINSPKHLIGDYVAMVWDAAAKSMFCIRDPMQTRRLYYWSHGPRVLWATDPRLLLVHPDISFHYDPVYLTTYLVSEARNWERTPYAAIRQIPGGHCLSFNAAGVRTQRWWELPEPESIRYRHSGDYQAQLRDLIRQAVKSRLRSQKPVSIALSRGIDSACIAATALDLIRSGEAPCPALHGITASLVTHPCGDESADASVIATHLGLSHTLLPNQEHPFLGDPRSVMGRFFEPHPMFGFWNLWDLLREGAQSVGSDVLLTGAGGGEMFNCQPDYLCDLFREGRFAMFAAELHKWTDNGIPLQKVLLRTWRGLNDPQHFTLPSRRLHLYPWIKHPDMMAEDVPLEIRHPAHRGFWRGFQCDARSGSFFDQALYQPNGIDRRHPLWDRRIVEFSYALPLQQKIAKAYNKPLIRETFSDWLPVSLTKSNAPLHNYVNDGLQQAWPAFKAIVHDPPHGLDQVVNIDVLRQHASDMRRDAAGYRFLIPVYTLGCWLLSRSSGK